MGLVALLEKYDLLSGEPHPERCHVIVKMIELRGADNRRGDARFGQQPRKRDLGRLQAAPFGKLDDASDDREVGVGVIELRRKVIALRPRRIAEIFLPPIAGKKPARQGTPRNDADSFLAAE